MPYLMPIGLVSLEKHAGFPMFISTVLNYGNKEWGGAEFMDVVSEIPIKDVLFTFMDYDPVTGSVLRQAVRSQLNIRVERGPLIVNLAGSQDRCVAPTKNYLSGQAYGCYAYIPLLFYEDAKVIATTEFFDLTDHYYLRPERAKVLTTYFF
jgi:hypothetical protein